MGIYGKDIQTKKDLDNIQQEWIDLKKWCKDTGNKN